MPPPRQRLPDCPIERSIVFIAGRWKAMILWRLFDAPQRYRDLEAGVAGITQRALSLALAELSADGVGARAGEVWALTDRGQELRAPLMSLDQWGSRIDDALGAPT